MYLDRFEHGVQYWVMAHKVPASCTMLFAQTMRNIQIPSLPDLVSQYHWKEGVSKTDS